MSELLQDLTKNMKHVGLVDEDSSDDTDDVVDVLTETSAIEQPTEDLASYVPYAPAVQLYESSQLDDMYELEHAKHAKPDTTKYKARSLQELCTMFASKKRVLDTSLVMYNKCNPSSVISVYRDQVSQMDDTNVDKASYAETFNLMLTLRRQCRTDKFMRHMFISLGKAFDNLEDIEIDGCVQLQKDMIDITATVNEKKAELLKKRQRELDDNVALMMGGVDAKKHKKPPGRAPKGKEWNEHLGQWVDIGSGTSGAGTSGAKTSE